MPKLAVRLTDIKVKAAKPKENPYKLAAGRGLYLLVKSVGRLFKRTQGWCKSNAD